MIGYSLNPVFMAVIHVASLHSRACTSGVEANELNKVFVFVIKASRICYELYVTFEKRHGIKHLHLLPLLVLDVLFGVGKP